jgi:hypothetical protein
MSHAAPNKKTAANVAAPMTISQLAAKRSRLGLGASDIALNI